MRNAETTFRATGKRHSISNEEIKQSSSNKPLAANRATLHDQSTQSSDNCILYPHDSVIVSSEDEDELIPQLAT